MAVAGGPGRRGAAALLGAALLAAGLTACHADGGSDASNADPRSPSPTTTTGEGDGGGSTTTTTRPGQPDPDRRPDDVPDPSFPGLGDPRIDVRTETVVLDARSGRKEIRGDATLVLRPVGRLPLRSFTLDLRGPKVQRLTVDGRVAAVRASDAELTITPARPLRPGRDATVRVAYRGIPDQTVFPVLGAPVGWQADDSGGWFTMSEPNGTSTWAPTNDHPSDKAVWSITVDAGPTDTVVSNGELVSHAKRGDGTRWRWREREPMAPYLVLVAVGQYDLIRRTTPDGTRILVAVPPDLSPGDRKGFDQIDDIVAFFSKEFGGRADDDAGAILVDKELGLALETQTRPLFGRDSLGGDEIGALAHELGHQWFGDQVTCARWPDLWLNEGFATYADWLWQDHEGNIDLDAYAQVIADRYADTALTVRDTEAATTFDPVVYERGALTLHALRKTVGDETFFRILRTWLRRYRGRSATSDQFVALASELAKRDLTEFFASWLDRAPQPKLPS